MSLIVPSSGEERGAGKRPKALGGRSEIWGGNCCKYKAPCPTVPVWQRRCFKDHFGVIVGSSRTSLLLSQGH